MPPSYDAPAVWARHALSRRVLRTVSAGLGRVGVPVLAVKGVVTAGWLYDDPSERPLADIDVRVRPAHLRAVLRACGAEGWRVERRIRSYGTMVIGVDGVAVDVESRLGPPGLTALPVEALFARATRDEGGFWVPEPHDHALVLTLNVFKDKIAVAMPWALEDVARVVNVPGFDPHVYVARVREAGVVAVAWIVADWMATEREHARWREIRALLGGEAPGRRVYTARVRRLFASADPFSAEVRLLARIASDDPRRWPGAVVRSLAGELESRWHRRISRGR